VPRLWLSLPCRPQSASLVSLARKLSFPQNNSTPFCLVYNTVVVAYAKIAATGFQLNWQSVPFDGGERKKKAASKTKYTCPTCGANAWAKPDTQLICGACYEEDDGEINVMRAEPAQDDQQEAA
ncbi:MAG: hypothetical protein M3Y57_08460, partial [Acidobacteriota bacterium]|nr:hypothetical protein [Acidobacteriota bacterium]